MYDSALEMACDLALAQETEYILWRTDATGHVTTDLPAWRSITGQTVAACQGLGFLDAIHPDERERAVADWQSAVAAQRKYHVTYRLRRADGAYCVVEIQATPVLLASGEVGEWVGINRDLTNQMQSAAELSTLRHVAEQTQREWDIEEQFHTTLESIVDGVIVYDRLGKILHINTAGQQMFASSASAATSDFTEQPVEERADHFQLHDLTGRKLSPDENPVARVLRGETLRGPTNVEVGLMMPGKGEVLISVSGMPLRDASGTLNGAILISRDITAQRHAEQALRDNEQRLHHIFAQAPIGLICMGLDGKYLSVNDRFCEIIGYSAEELLQRTAADITHPEDVQLTYVGMQNTLVARRSLWRIEKRYLHKDGHEVWASVDSAVIPHADGTPAYFFSIIEDRTERHAREAQEQAMAEAARRLQLTQRVIEQLPSATYLVRGLDARLVLANAATNNVWGGTWNVGVALADFLASVGTQVFRQDGQTLIIDHFATLSVIRSGKPIMDWQQVIHHADGSQLPVILNAVPFDGALLGWRDRFGRVENGALIVMQDMTSLQEGERIKQEFLAMAAHELRTPIGVVSGYAQLLDSLLPQTETTVEQREVLASIQIAAGRLGQLANDLLDVSRLDAGHLHVELEQIDLAMLTQRVVDRMRVTAQEHTLHLRTPRSVITVMGDQLRLEQVITNLLTNAVKYSPAGGTVYISLGRSRQRGQALLAVHDEGIGIPQKDQARIFGRFARAENARAQGIMGTGLGLHLCKELVERQGGRIWFTSTEGQGTTFFITLPLAGATADHAVGSVAGAGIR